MFYDWGIYLGNNFVFNFFVLNYKYNVTYCFQVVEEELPYDYLSVLDLEEVKANSSYQCRASNDFGQDNVTVTVQAIDTFVALNVSEGNTIYILTVIDVKFMFICRHIEINRKCNLLG